MDQALTTTRRPGVSPSSLAASVAPILVLLGFNTRPDLSILQIALAQLVTILLVQILSIYSSVTVWRPRRAIAVAAGPVKLEIAGQEDDGVANPGLPKEAGVQTMPLVDATAGQRRKSIPPTVAPAPAAVDPMIAADLKPGFPPASGMAIQEHSLYSNKSIDSCLRRLLALVDSDQLQYLPGSDDGTELAPPVPLSSWQAMLTTPACRVAKHPSIPHLYSISAAYADIPLRSLWELLIDIKQRPNWDSMCYATEDIDAIGLDDQTEGTTRQASITYLATKGMFPVKATDMVMLSVNAQLLPTTTKRLVCATTTVEHPDKPVYRSYTRMSLNVSGFIAEDDGNGGCSVTQITDLSALGSWVPSRMIKLVTESLIPRSLVRIGEAARQHKLVGRRAALIDDAWLPPVLGTWELPTRSVASSVTLVGDHTKDDSDALTSKDDGTHAEMADSVSSLDNLPASSARDINELVSQLRQVNQRLSHLETATGTLAPAFTPTTSAPPFQHVNGGALHPPSAPVGVGKVTGSALISANESSGPLGWLSRAAGSISLRGFLTGLGAGIFSTTSAATIAAVAVYYFRKQLK